MDATKSELSTCVVTVTYGDRFKFLESTIRAAIAAGARRVVAVDNGSSLATKEGLQALGSELGEALVVVTCAENLGSAGGYKVGMEKAETLVECDFIWLLDDDNRARPDALNTLWAAYRMLGGEVDNTLMSQRSSATISYLRSAAETGRPTLRQDAFLDFHVFDLPGKLTRRLRSRIKVEKTCFPLVPVQVALYGGFFFHRHWLKRVGFPDERFYLYVDDTEFTSRIPRAGGRIYLCFHSQIEDIDLSWYNAGVTTHRWLDAHADERRVYLMVRNKAYVGRKWTLNPSIYRLNQRIFLSLLWIYAWGSGTSSRSHLRSRFRLIRKAIAAGEAGQLGPWV